MSREPDMIEALNRMSAAGFSTTLAAVYEHSPWVAEQAAQCRPFATIEVLAGTMQRLARDADPERRLRLLRAHPELGQGGHLTDHSSSEQSFAGFDRLTPESAEQLAFLNRRYRERFGFPFIIAVRGQKDAPAIIERLEQRLGNDPPTEMTIALEEIGRIAWFRLQQLREPAR
ncbi:MAG: OHCU decarboxylase [Acidiphilium sp. 37-64-53]|uniref:2-oxo-4-hydroxy-4-carboxy-5-ureidoimidazoline decarboxylase n=2 Tax=Acidocellaceae TaxID=3385905 RepID=UPI000BD5901A|nr:MULTISPECIES: 2-oxo-4-hydroxy-4-carboxy-5-ureidoimidazoline decarboxylase [unclassified Acidiphilium]OYW02011.1 MAG: OHCU decarboxylase [Acidiphilium sp. 37-64-53]OZB26724.1 MAG: OHCU decarboxylase [Acidiphilium sp. 34-64-41]